MGRIEDLTNRQVATMPLPRPEGTRLARVRLWAHAALGLEEQATAATEQLGIGAAIYWAPVFAADGTTPATTPLPANLPTGASTHFLDDWGRVLQSGRRPDETDAAYSRRVVAETLAPALTNIGMASEINRLLGYCGTQVLEAATFFDPLRADDGHQSDDGLRASPITDPLWNTFVVVLPLAVGSDAETAAIVALCDQKKAAGNRLYAILTSDGTPQINAPEAVIADQTFSAAITRPEGGATFTWTITHGTIASGQGTPNIVVTPTAGQQYVTVQVEQSGGTMDGQTTTTHVYVAK